jgi:competence protein ComEA
MWDMIRGYLTFTRKERIGVLFLLLIICILFILPYFFRPSIGQPDPAASAKMKEGILKFESQEKNTNEKAVTYEHPDVRKSDSVDGSGLNDTRVLNARLFNFDPNNLDAEGWRRLGLPDKLVQTIIHYTEKGGRFRIPGDMKKLYGLHNSDYERLLPYIRIENSPNNLPQRTGKYFKTFSNVYEIKKSDSLSPASSMNMGSRFVYPVKRYNPIDINLSDSTDWSRLPGIGEKLAARIVHFREKLGGFYEVDQVGETFGLPDSVFQKIRPGLRLSTFTLNKIDLNLTSEEKLKSHPYIRWQIARAIIEYRMQHGGFQSVDELLQLAQMDQAKFEKLKPYLSVTSE